MNGLNRVEAIVLAVLSLLAGAALCAPVALWYGTSHGTAIGNAKVAELREQTAIASAKTLRDAGEVLAEETARGNRLSAQLDQAHDRIDFLSHQLQSKVDHVSTVYRPAPGAPTQPLPQCVFTRGWLRSYNAAIGVDVSIAGEGTGPSAQAADAGGTVAGEDDLLPAGIDQRDILSHHIDYAARARKLEEALNRLIDYEEGKDVQ
ncbi:hypothetical protein [Cupriavidus pauculus]|uniref:hypothetical protein n=1 Tax=Cupriavidus pauculus TaxID=82633 RepID=UPI003857AEC8